MKSYVSISSFLLNQCNFFLLVQNSKAMLTYHNLGYLCGLLVQEALLYARYLQNAQSFKTVP